jgi:hypothetical protein
MDFQFCFGGGLTWGLGGKKNIFFDFVENDGQSVFYKACVDEIWFSNKFCFVFVFVFIFFYMSTQG